MSKYRINNVDKFIKFIIPLFAENCNMIEIQNNRDAIIYFTHGGCYEFAKAIKHFFKTSKFVINNNNDHIAILYNGEIYDAYNYLSEEELFNLTVHNDDIHKNLTKFEIINEDEIEKYNNFGMNIKIEDKSIDKWIIDEINDIESIEVYDENIKTIKRTITYK